MDPVCRVVPLLFWAGYMPAAAFLLSGIPRPRFYVRKGRWQTDDGPRVGARLGWGGQAGLGGSGRTTGVYNLWCPPARGHG